MTKCDQKLWLYKLRLISGRNGMVTPSADIYSMCIFSSYLGYEHADIPSDLLTQKQTFAVNICAPCPVAQFSAGECFVIFFEKLDAWIVMIW